MSESYNKTTIVFPIHESGIILGMKKQGFGKDWWNGFGGKLEAGETYEQAAIRETHEESGIDVKSLFHIANLHFYFNDTLGVVSRAYISEYFTGEPIETDEMRPASFALNHMPFDSMWPADEHWIPKALNATASPLGFIVRFGDDNSFRSIEEVDARLLEEKF